MILVLPRGACLSPTLQAIDGLKRPVFCDLQRVADRLSRLEENRP
jgi:hypothetical protein